MASYSVAQLSDSGIYEIVNKVNGNRYIGSAAHIKKRWVRHTNSLICGDHHNRHLQAAWNLYGKDAFEYRIIELCDKRDLLRQEQRAIDQINPAYNIHRIAGSAIGCVVSAETRKKISNKLRGNKWSEEAKAKLSASITGRKMSPEFCEKLRGNKYAAGVVFSPERRAKVSVFMTGRKRPKIDKPSKSLGLKRSEEVRKRISDALKGHQHHTPKSRAKISQTSRDRWNDPVQRTLMLERQREGRNRKKIAA